MGVDGPNFIAVPDACDITAAWLTAALRSRGIDAEIAAVTSKPIGTGQVGDTYRYSLTFANGRTGGLPPTIVGKHHSGSEEARAIAKQLDLYLNEFMFYKEIAPSADVPVARPLYVERDTDDRFVLLLEDLAPAEPADQLVGITREQARLGVLAAAKLHACHWGDESLAKSGWINSRPLAQGVATAADIVPLWPGFEQRVGDFLDAPLISAGRQFVAAFAEWNRPLGGPRSITHNDYRPDNFMFGTSAGGAPFSVVDWQTVTFHYGALDVAYLIGGAFEGDERAELEHELLPQYHDALCAAGVRDFPFSELERQYRYFTFAGMTVAIIALMSVKRTERGDKMLSNMYRLHCTHALAHDALKLLR